MSKDIGIDLGTSNIVIWVRGRGIVINEPSVIAKDSNTGRIIKFGKDAREMSGRTPDYVTTLRPIADGVISRYEETVRLLQYDIRRVCGGAVIKPRVLVGVPVDVTEVERRAVFDAVIAAGAKKVFIEEEPLLCALGAGLDIKEADGKMIVDIGGGTTDIAVISVGKIVAGGCLRTAGDEMNDAIIRYVRRKENLNIGERSAEDAKIAIGSIVSEKPGETEVTGIDTVEGLPKRVKLTNADLKEALEEPLMAIVTAIIGVLEKTPPELLEDIRNNGITLTGGGALMAGLDKLIELAAGYRVTVAPDPLLCAANGAKRFFDEYTGK